VYEFEFVRYEVQKVILCRVAKLFFGCSKGVISKYLHLNVPITCKAGRKKTVNTQEAIK
jgi:hypothetical protein